MNHNNFCQPPTTSCNCPSCSGHNQNQGNNNKPNKPNSLGSSSYEGKFCASKDQLLVYSPPGESSEKIPFDKICLEGGSIFAQKKSPDFVILKDGCYCLNFKADRIENESTPVGFNPINIEINIYSSISGLIASVPTPVNGQAVDFCRQFFLKAGEILFLQLKHDINTETVLDNYSLSVKHLRNCSQDCCQETDESQSQQQSCSC